MTKLPTNLLWHASSVELPTESMDNVLVVREILLETGNTYHSMSITTYSSKHKKFNAYDVLDTSEYGYIPTYWAEFI